MTTIIISDTHLTARFNHKKYRYLQKIFSQADRVILNGDFWDGYATSFEKFVNSPWKNLFPILKRKKTIYIYGNHDTEKMSDQRRSLFSDRQLERLEIVFGNKKLILEHGNKISPAFNDRIPKFLVLKIFVHIWQLFNFLAFKILGKNYYYFNKRRNIKMKKWMHDNLSKNSYLFCGHSHVAEMNLALRYANTGFIRYGYGHYIKIQNKKISLVSERYLLDVYGFEKVVK